MAALQKHSWLIFLLLALGSVWASLILLRGNPPNPPSPQDTTGLSYEQMAERIPGLPTYVGSLSRQMGNFMLTLGILMGAIAAIPFRRGERWAWYALWTAPLLLLIQFVNSNFGRGWWADLGLVPVTLLGLLGSYRKFFPKRPP